MTRSLPRATTRIATTALGFTVASLFGTSLAQTRPATSSGALPAVEVVGRTEAGA